MNFLELVEKSADEFVKCSGRVKIVSHLDSDGICAASIIIQMLEYKEIKYAVSILPYLDIDLLKQLSKEKFDIFIFTDLGSGNLDDIEALFLNKKVFVLDHHKPNGKVENTIHLNPHLCDVDGSSEISGAGVSYFFSKAIEPKIKNMSPIALVGAIGDLQEKNGFSELNSEILSDAKNYIKVEKGIKFFGYQTRAIHKLLEYCNDPVIPGITGNEKAAIKFLQDLEIYTNGWRKLPDLSKEEMLKLVEALKEKTNQEDILWDNYILIDEELTQFKDLREFSTLLNACGRMGKPSIGIGACLGDSNMKKQAIECLSEYKSEIVKTMDWFNKNRTSKNIIETDNYVIINAKDKVMSTVIGTLASLLSKSHLTNDGKFVMTLARIVGNKTKISLRSAGNKEDLREIIKEIIQKIKAGEFGGHKYAAGALIPTDKEEAFIEEAQKVLEKKAMEEGIS